MERRSFFKRLGLFGIAAEKFISFQEEAVRVDKDVFKETLPKINKEHSNIKVFGTSSELTNGAINTNKFDW